MVMLPMSLSDRNPLATIGSMPQMVELMNGDEVIAKSRPRSANLVKIDVVGREFEALQGMARLLRHSQLSSFLSEFRLQPWKSEPARLFRFGSKACCRPIRFNLLWLDPSHIHAHH